MYNKNDLTIVINTFNSDEKIYSCLDSINQDYKILIIENSKNIKFKENIEKKYSNVVCELTGENLGYAKGNNLGLSKVKSIFALVLNPDTLMKKKSIDNFFNTALKYDDFAIIAPAIQEKKDFKILEKNNNVFEVESVKGFAMFLNLDKFKDVGFFDDNFFIYFEEIDLCRRLKQLNKKIYLDSSIKIDHMGGSSHNQSIDFEMELSRNWHWMWSTFYYHKKYSGFFYAVIKISSKFFSALTKVLFYSILLNNNKKKIYFQRLSGLFNSITGKKSWYRPNVS
ncbi:glycosyltransferase [Pelagibacteraceae bacterium]|nr:glycosyltransferase [Pelagibacteraceae bacterium]MDC0365824.1 glycosyltransferase [Pelagibacteraceae bacterium]